ncbi:MAG: putative rane protein [Lachnospiraceae bacterium]|nr:putative rane protein [Lachnospiraceae bacterium]
MLKTKVKGSYTVEAAFLMPMVLFVTIAVLYLGFYLHDRARVQSIMNDALTNSRSLIQYEADMNTGSIDYAAYRDRDIWYPYFNEFKEKEGGIIAYVTNQFEKGLFLTKLEDAEVTINTFDITINASIRMDFPFFELQQILVNSSQQETISYTNNTIFSVEFIRIYDTFLGVAEKTELVQEILNHNLLRSKEENTTK